MRPNKGNAHNGYIADYTVIDLETTGLDPNQSKILEISALKVRDNKVVAEYSTLVNPQEHIPSDVSKINNITDAMVADCPDLDAVLDDFLAFLGDDVIVGYNVGFDINMLYDRLMALRGMPLRNDYLDVLTYARRCLTYLPDRKLETVSHHYGLDTTGEHRALKDCYLTKDCYDRFYEEFGTEAFLPIKPRATDSKSKRTTDQRLLELQNRTLALINASSISVEDLLSLQEWLSDNADLSGKFMYDGVFGEVEQAVGAGFNQAQLKHNLAIYADPVNALAQTDPITSIKGKHLVVTGHFDYGSRDTVYHLIDLAGGIIDKNVQMTTDYIVVGALGNDRWKTGSYGSKIESAVKLTLKGSPVAIVREMDFIPAVEALTSYAGSLSQQIRDMLEALIIEDELPSGSLYLSDNYGGKDKSTLIGHSICIWEPDYPPMPSDKPGPNKIVTTITYSTVKSRPDDVDLSIREEQLGDLRQFLPEDAVIFQSGTERASGFVRVRFNKMSPTIIDYLRRNTQYCIDTYVSKATRFGCCSSFERCSDAKKCVHANKLYSKACMYRDHLDNGRIFYGKNRNID